MAKNKERSEVEFLRGQNKALRTEIRQLKRDLARHQKRQHELEDREEELQEMFEEQTVSEMPHEVQTKTACLKCGSGGLETIDLGIRTIIKCTNCGNRETKK